MKACQDTSADLLKAYDRVSETAASPEPNRCEHNRSLGTLDVTRAEKAEMVRNLTPSGLAYRRLGQRVAELADRAIFVGGNFQRYAAGATRSGLSREALISAGTSLQTAVEAVRQELSPGDVVLVKGRDTQRLDRVSWRWPLSS
jgi:hypothetical protein